MHAGIKVKHYDAQVSVRHRHRCGTVMVLVATSWRTMGAARWLLVRSAGDRNNQDVLVGDKVVGAARLISGLLNVIGYRMICNEIIQRRGHSLINQPYTQIVLTFYFNCLSNKWGCFQPNIRRFTKSIQSYTSVLGVVRPLMTPKDHTFVQMEGTE